MRMYVKVMAAVIACILLSGEALSAFATTPATENLSWFKKKKKKPEEKEEKSKSDYEKLVEDSKTTKGMFAVHQKKNDYYFEIPTSLLGRDLLVVNKLQRVPAELNDAGVNRGVNYENQMVCMELMEFLAAKMPDASRTKLKSLLSKRVVFVDNVITTQFNFPLKPGMKVQISKDKGRKEFNNRLLKIVYEDAYIIVVEKMQGLLSVNTERQKERTAYTILNEYVQRSGRQFRVFIVHRLDRDTSGLMMFAKDEKTQRTLRDNWHEIVTDRRYVAVVEGSMEKDYDTVVSWLTDKTLYVSSSEYDDGGSKSITHYKTIKRANGYSLLELDLETGRKNQIRVHMQDLGHPIIGDGRYGREDSPNPIGRLALHAFKLCFYHPVTGDLMEFETPYPAEFKKLFLKK